MLRGRGLMATRGPYHDKQFRRLTVAKIQEAVSADHSFVLEVGQRGPFAAVFVLPKTKHQDFDADSMRLLADLFFAETVESCEASFPKIEGVRSWSTLRGMLSKFVVCARPVASTGALDLGRDGMIKGITEHSEYLKTVFGDPVADFLPIRAAAGAAKRRKRAADSALDGLATPKRCKHAEGEGVPVPIAPGLPEPPQQAEPATPEAEPPAASSQPATPQPAPATPFSPNRTASPESVASPAPLQSRALGSLPTSPQSVPSPVAAQPGSSLADAKETVPQLQCRHCRTWRVVAPGVHAAYMQHAIGFECRVVHVGCETTKLKRVLRHHCPAPR